MTLIYIACISQILRCKLNKKAEYDFYKNSRYWRTHLQIKNKQILELKDQKDLIENYFSDIKGIVDETG
jgi:hypothetical protein